jgi:hypothetical protein
MTCAIVQWDQPYWCTPSRDCTSGPCGQTLTTSSRCQPCLPPHHTTNNTPDPHGRPTINQTRQQQDEKGTKGMVVYELTPLGQTNLLTPDSHTKRTRGHGAPAPLKNNGFPTLELELRDRSARSRYHGRARLPLDEPREPSEEGPREHVCQSNGRRNPPRAEAIGDSTLTWALPGTRVCIFFVSPCRIPHEHGAIGHPEPSEGVVHTLWQECVQHCVWQQTSEKMETY